MDSGGGNGGGDNGEKEVLMAGRWMAKATRMAEMDGIDGKK